MKIFRSLILLQFILSCAHHYQPDKTYELTLLHTNDHHGRFWSNNKGEWGLAARATLIDTIRQEVKSKNGLTLLLDAGDVNTGVPQSDMLKAEPDFKGMSKLGYDVMAVGNHEFDNDIETIRLQEKWAGFPFITANVYHQGKRLFRPYVIKEIQGLKVAILGLTTLDTPVTSKLGANKDIAFTDPIEEAKVLVPQLKEQAHIVIALTHMGHYPNQNHGPNSPGDVTLARQVNGIDLIIGGHSQLPLYEADIQNNTIIVQAYEWGKYLGRVDLAIKNKKIELKRYELIPVNHADKGTRVEEKKSIKNFLKPYKERGDKVLQIEVGFTSEKLEGDRSVVRSQETNLGYHIAQAQRLKFNADIGLTNSGGIRDSIQSGSISYETVLTVQPFGNDIVTVEMAGDEFKKYLAYILTNATPGSGSFPQTAGLEVDYDVKSNKFKKLLINNRPFESKRKYKISLSSFLADGGDKWPNLKSKNPRVYGFTDAQIIREYFEQNNPLPATSQRPRVKVTY